MNSPHLPGPGDSATWSRYKTPSQLDDADRKEEMRQEAIQSAVDEAKDWIASFGAAAKSHRPNIASLEQCEAFIASCIKSIKQAALKR